MGVQLLPVRKESLHRAQRPYRRLCPVSQPFLNHLRLDPKHHEVLPRGKVNLD